ncbi:MAG: hypothetical protein ACR2OU_13920 [Thermomicrobiales bacterium]
MGVPTDHINDRRMRNILEEPKDELDALTAMSDETINFSDIPEMRDEEWLAVLKRGVYRLLEQQRALQKQITEDRRSKRVSPSTGQKKSDTTCTRMPWIS